MGKTSRSGSGCRVSLSRRLLKRVWLVRVDALKVRESPNGVVERAISGVRCRMFAHCAGDRTIKRRKCDLSKWQRPGSGWLRTFPSADKQRRPITQMALPATPRRKLRVLTIVDTLLALLALLAASRAPVHISRRRRCRRARKSRPASRVAVDDPGRSRHRVRVPRFGSVGLSARRNSQLLQAGGTDRQRLHRS